MNKIKIYIPYIILIIICFCWFQSCEHQKSNIKNLKTEISIDSLDFTILNNKIAIQEIKIITDKKLIKDLTSKVNGIKNINRQVKATIITKYVNIEAKPIETIKIIKDSISLDNYMKLPQSFNYKGEWLVLNHSIDTLGNSIIDTLEVTTKPLITFGYKDEGTIKNLFKKNIAVVSYSDENPFSQVKGLQNIEYKPKTKWYNKKIATFSIGLILGTVILK